MNFPKIKRAKLFLRTCDNDSYWQEQIREERRSRAELAKTLANCLSEDWNNWDAVPFEVQKRFLSFLNKIECEEVEDIDEAANWWFNEDEECEYYWRARFVAYELNCERDEDVI
jgi:hypothetical protein